MLHLTEGRMNGEMDQKSAAINQYNEVLTRVDVLAGQSSQHTAKETLNWFQEKKKGFLNGVANHLTCIQLKSYGKN